MAADEEVNTRMSDDQVLASVFSLLIWLYQIDLPISSRQAIEQQMRSGWQNQDLSEQQLVSCLLQMNQTVIQSGDPDCHLVNAWETFKNEFAATECTPPDQLDDKGRLLVVIHRAIESIRPGSTGVAASAFSAEGKRLAVEPHYVDDADMQFRLAQNRQKLFQQALWNNRRMFYEMATKTIIEPALPRKD
jgi:hypothetical protein